MKLNTQSLLALSASHVLAVPPADFGFPTASDDTILATAYYQDNGTYQRVDPGILFGSQIAIPGPTNSNPVVGLNLSALPALRDYTGNYIAMMVDPDASSPENPTNRFILHWMQGNISLEDPSNPRFPNTDLVNALPGVTILRNSSLAIVPYAPPRPPPTSSAHRYILYAFRQPDDFQIPEAFSGISAANRTRFNLTEFIRAANLGTPTAANYFYASNQSSVPPNYIAPPGEEYPGGNGNAVTSGDPATSTQPPSSTSAGGSSGSGPSSTSSSTGGAPMMTGVGSLVGAGLLGLAALL